MRFTEEELEIAKRVDLCAVASHLGYTVKRVGKYHTLKEMDSIRIYDRSHWFRWSRQYDTGQNGGSQIDFLRVFAGMEVKEAVFWLLDFAGYKRTEVSGKTLAKEHPVKEEREPPKVFILPEYAGSNAHVYQYLQTERGIAKEVIDFFVKQGLLYEEKQHHNLVFVGKDKSGTPRFASMRGIYDRNGKAFKCDVAGNDKRYGVNVVRESSTKVIVFEAVIDMMSYMTIFPDEKVNMIALGMLGDAPLKTFLQEHGNIHSIQFCLDNDEPGRKAADKLTAEYKQMGYETNQVSAPIQYKDFNEWLVGSEKERKMSDRNRVI